MAVSFVINDRYNCALLCRGGGTGRRAGFKIRFLHGSVGSIPTLGTSYIHNLLEQRCNNQADNSHKIYQDIHGGPRCILEGVTNRITHDDGPMGVRTFSA